ncbi:MAG: metallophosphoesterase, partial [Bacteroidales bacterium]|nr:metallophosphoesterase [Bacteroidales bacterium]
IMGIVKWATDFRVIRQSISLSGLPSVFKGLKIVQISDLHLGSWASNDALEEAVGMINNLQPDLVFFTGDILNYTTSEAFPYEPILAEIRARHGVFSVLGNHDYGEYVGWDSESDKIKNLNDLIEFYDRMGWTLLRNNNRVIKIGSGKIGVVGVDNWSVYNRFPSLGDLDLATKGMENVDIKLLLSHDPSHWEHEVLKDFTDIDITFSGHTHGFQFGVEMPGFKWSPAKYLYKHWAGLYSKNSDQNKEQYLYVNRGLGNIGYPGRIGILPEITLVELV